MINIGAEKNVENHIKSELKNYPTAWYCKFFANSNTKKGIPDILSVIDNKFTAFEVKRPKGGKPTPIQIKNLVQINKAGGIGYLTNDPHIVAKLTKNQPLKNVFTTYCPEKLLTVKEATNLWQHPNGNNTPDEPYSIKIIYQKENN